MSTTNNRLQISAAVLLLLAGCGGGGGGSEAPKAVSASPSATTTTATNAAAANAASTAAANTAAQRAAEQAATQAASQANAARNAANQATAALQAAQAAAREAEAKRAEAEAANKRAAEAEAALQKATAERRAAEEAQAKAAREDAARKQAEADAAKKAKEEADAKAKADAEKAKQAEAKAKEDAAAAAKAAEEAAAKAKEEADAAAKTEEPAAPTSVPPSSGNGVSGLMLATMLDQAMTTNRTQQANLEALPAEGTHGNLLEDADAPTVNAAQYTDPSNYVGGGQGRAGNYQPANGTYYYHLFNGGVEKPGKDAAFKMNTVGIKLKVEATTDKVELDNELQVSDAIGESSIEAAPTFTAGFDVSLQKNELVSRIDNAGIIQTWHGPNDQSVQLMLRESSESGATLCWNYTLTNTNRLYCNRWQIPAGWKAGQPLTFLSYYIHETRKVDGANKNYYWHTRTH